jgi:S-adenosyl methyltransferase
MTAAPDDSIGPRLFLTEDDWPSNITDGVLAHPARVYDHWLGGKDNFAADRTLAEQISAAYPPIRDLARENRRFLTRAVRYTAERGIQQFVDIGTGYPTTGDLANTHEVAQRVTPQARVSYVDNDPVVVVHAQALLADESTTRAINGDLREPKAILSHPELRATIDLARPVAVLLVAVLHFITDDDDPYGIVDTLVDAMAPGSYLILSHGTSDFATPEEVTAAADLYQQATAPLVLRTRAQAEPFLTGTGACRTWTDPTPALEAGERRPAQPGTDIRLRGCRPQGHEATAMKVTRRRSSWTQQQNAPDAAVRVGVRDTERRTTNITCLGEPLHEALQP